MRRPETPPAADQSGHPTLPQPVCYNPHEVLDCARRLQAQAAFIIGTFTVMGLIAGAVLIGVGAYELAKAYAGQVASVVAVHGAVLGAAFGAAGGNELGKTWSVSLRLRAQNALCLMAIEANTRNGEP